MPDQEPSAAVSAAILDEVFATIRERQRLLPEGSYVTHLLQGGTDEIARKVGEEAIEVVLAAKNAAAHELTGEIADLWFHCLVLLAQSGCTPDDIYRELAQRHGKRPRFQQKAEARAQLPSVEDL